MDRSLGRNVGIVLRAAGMRIELHDDHFKEDTPDEKWLVTVGARGWVALTKDKGIRRKPQEREAVLTANVRLFTLASGSMTGQEMADIYLQNRLRIGRFLKNHAPPFVAVVSRSGIVLVAPKPSS